MITSSLPPPAGARALRSRPKPSRRPLAPQWRFEGRYVRVGAIPSSKVVVVERTAVPSGAADVAEVFGPAERAVHEIERAGLGLLIDVRRAPGRNDAEFERKFEPYRRRIQLGFRRVAVVVATAHGKLQVQRYAREDGMPTTVFDDFKAAVNWLEQS